MKGALSFTLGRLQEILIRYQCIRPNKILSYIPSVIQAKKLRLDEISQGHNSFVVLIYCVAGLGGEKRNAVVDTIVKGQVMTFEFEFPVNGVEIVFFVGKADVKRITENIGYLVEPFQPSIISNDSFGAS